MDFDQEYLRSKLMKYGDEPLDLVRDEDGVLRYYLPSAEPAQQEERMLPPVEVVAKREAPIAAAPKPKVKPMPAAPTQGQLDLGEAKPIKPAGAMSTLKTVGEMIQAGAEKIDFDVLGLPGIGTLTLKDLTVGDLGKVLVNIAEGFPPITGSGQTLSPTIEAAELINVAPVATGAVKLAKKAGPKIVESLAPVVGEAFERYAATTGLTSYIVQPKRSLGTLVKKLESGAMDEQSYIEGTKLLNDALQKRPEKVLPEDRVRGADHITSRLLASLSPTAKIQLQEPTVRFAKWLLDNNPQLANELAISIKTGSKQSSTAGKYTTDTGDNLFDRVATIFASGARETTAVHEILHHTEQMMPIEVQNGVTDAWTKGYLKAYRESSPEVQAYLKFIPKAISGDSNAQKEILNGFKDGVLDYSKHYQFVNPSEYWAVNATRLMQSRYEAGSWIGKAKVWLGEFTEKAKGAFGLQSDAPVLKGLQSVIKGTGELQTGMLVRSSNVSASANRVREQKVKREKTISNIKKGAAVTATGAALTGDEGQQ